MKFLRFQDVPNNQLMLLLFYSTKIIPATSTKAQRQYLNAKIALIFETTKFWSKEKWRFGSPDLLHIDTFSKNNNSYSRA